MRKQKNHAQYTYAKDLGGLELLSARYKDQNFSRHVHEGYCIGVIESGAQRFYRSGVNHLAAQDSIILVNADQVHDGHTASENGWSYRAMYPLPEMLEDVCVEFQGARRDATWFSESVVSDPKMAQELRYLFNFLDTSDNALARETLYFDTLSALISRHGKSNKPLLELRNESQAIARVQEYIDAHFAENITLQSLAGLTKLSPFYLARLFTKAIGLPPHAYQVQRRLHKAKQLIRHNVKLTDVAIDCGFTDQSHLSRHFKRSMGIAPGAFQRMCAYGETDQVSP